MIAERSALTSAQAQLFRHNGFLMLPSSLPEERVARLKETICRHIDEAIPPVMCNRQGRVVRISQLWDRDAIFREAFTCEEVMGPLRDVIGPNIEFIKNRHNHATLRITEDGSSYFHRDVLQWSRTIVTVLFYLEETTVENGCTFVVPGSHLMPGLGAVNIEKDEAILRTGLLEQAVPIPMPAGGLVLIDSAIIHGAGPNRTSGTRMSMTAGYHSVDELAGMENPRRVLISGERLYMGNDR
jgi:ectoine hydroxylase-related dioxygenase (phytanoyl-CoA dioxygenase family)